MGRGVRSRAISLLEGNHFCPFAFLGDAFSTLPLPRLDPLAGVECRVVAKVYPPVGFTQYLNEGITATGRPLNDLIRSLPPRGEVVELGYANRVEGEPVVDGKVLVALRVERELGIRSLRGQGADGSC